MPSLHISHSFKGETCTPWIESEHVKLHDRRRRKRHHFDHKHKLDYYMLDLCDNVSTSQYQRPAGLHKDNFLCEMHPERRRFSRG